MAKNKQTFLQGALILIIANLTVKIIGAAFKIPLTYVLHEEGMGIFSTAYNLYAALFVIATAGIPVAVSKMVSESLVRHDYLETRRIFSVAKILLSIIGIAGALALYFGAPWLEIAMSAPNSTLAIQAIAPALLFVAILSAYRGYFQGHQDMVPTAISEVIESLGKLFIGLAIAIWLAKTTVEPVMPATGAILGVTLGTFFGWVSIQMIYIIRNKNNKLEPHNARPIAGTKSKQKIAKILIWIAVPITIGASVSTLTNLLDMVMVRMQLVSLGHDTLLNIVQNTGIQNITQSLDKAEYVGNMANAIYGSYSGYAVPLFNMPPTLVTAISMSIVPAIAAAFALKNRLEAQKTCESALRITVIFSVPCAFGLSVLAGPILQIVYHNTASASMLGVLGYAVIFMSVVSVTTAMLQATGKVMIPVIHMIIGGIIKVVINYFLVADPAFNINGAPIGTNICYLTIAILNLIQVKKVLNPKLTFGDFLIKPVFSAVVMAGVALLAYNGLGGGTIPTVIAMALSIVCYIVVMFLVNGVKKDDILLMPKGNKIADVFEKLHLIK